MTKTIIFILLFLSIHQFLNAQEQYINVNLGANIANIQSNPLNIFDQNRVKFLSEVNYEFIYKKNISISLGLNYIQRGSKDPVSFTDGNGMPLNGSNEYSYFFNYDYIGMPMKIGYRIKGKLNFTTRIGVIPSMLVEAKALHPKFKFENGSIEIDGYDKTDYRSITNEYDIVPILELETSYTIKDRVKLNVLLLFQHGLMNVNTSSFFDGKPNKHIGIGVQLGCKYDISEM